MGWTVEIVEWLMHKGHTSPLLRILTRKGAQGKALKRRRASAGIQQNRPFGEPWQEAHVRSSTMQVHWPAEELA
jgi:hypothetical protein